MIKQSFAVLLWCGLLPSSALAQEPSYNLLLVTIDTLRADHVGVNGSTKVDTPHLDRLAKKGVNFTRTRCAVPLTLPSHASILTGKYPPAHGVRDNGTYKLDESETTLAEVLKGHGYTTAAFVGSFVLDHRFGMAQGFDTYDDRTWTDPKMLESLYAERNADAVYQVFSRWLERYDRARPFFVWVHFYDPHAPYTPPEFYRSRYFNDPYAAEVAYTDAVVGRVIADLEGKGLLGRTLVAVVGDHGEGLGEHEETTHSLLIYNSTLHVPMMLHAPTLVPEGLEVTELTRTVDLAPTLLDYLGIPRAMGQGVSLRSHIEGRRLDIGAYSESLYPDLNLGWSALRGFETGNYRLILAPQPELYNVEDDPGETNNIITSRAGTARQLRGKLEELIEAIDSAGGESQPAALDPETEAKLRSLGYISTSRRPTGSGSGADPKAKMAIWNQIQLGLFQFAREDYTSAAVTLRKLLTAEPDILLLYEYLGASYMRLREYAEAEGVYRQALERGMESARFHLNLGLVHFYRKKLVMAQHELEVALALDDLHAEAYYRLGDVLRAMKNFDEAIEHYRRALEINPSYVYALNALGMSYATVGKDDDALEAFREMVRVDPDGPPGYFNLGMQLERMKRYQEALATYQKFLSLAPEDELSLEQQRASDAIRRLRDLTR